MSKNSDMNLEEILAPVNQYGSPLWFLNLFGWLNIVFSSLFLIVGIVGWYGEVNSLVTGIYAIAEMITLVSLFLNYMPSLVKHFQIFSYIIIALDAFVTLLWFDTMVLLSQLSDGKEVSFVSISSSETIELMIPILLLIVVGLIAFYIYHKYSTVAALNKWQKGKYAVSIPVIFIAVIIFRNLFADNFTFSKLLEIFLEVLLNLTFPGISLGALFSAVFLHKHPEYKDIDFKLSYDKKT